MERDDSINNVDITISVKEGTTTLTGTAGSFRAKWSAGAAAHRAGAKKVRNEILVVSF
jgi:osmotically-inducible protein OsmY